VKTVAMSRCYLIAIMPGLLGTACAVNQRPTISPSRMAELWDPPTDLGSRDLRYGPGGSKLVPKPGERFEFVSEKKTGTSPGYDVKDSKGRAWGVKMGPESRPETAVSHLLWALGYHQPVIYYMPRWTLVRDGKETVEKGGRFRLEEEKAGEWSWRKNPFLDTQPMAGLFVLMVMVNNWDIKTANNVIYNVPASGSDSVKQYVVKDLGGSFGKTAWPLGSTEDDPDEFDKESFILGVEGNRVRFGYQGPWLEPQLAGSITPADVRWAAELLSRLSERQWNDLFRSAGFTEAESDRYIRRLRQKIDEGLKISWY